MHLKKRQFIWGLTLFSMGVFVFFTQLWTFAYGTFNTYQLMVELFIMVLALAFIFVGARIVNELV